jgi:hypothetical protein
VLATIVDASNALHLYGICTNISASESPARSELFKKTMDCAMEQALWIVGRIIAGLDSHLEMIDSYFTYCFVTDTLSLPVYIKQKYDVAFAKAWIQARFGSSFVSVANSCFSPDGEIEDVFVKTIVGLVIERDMIDDFLRYHEELLEAEYYLLEHLLANCFSTVKQDVLVAFMLEWSKIHDNQEHITKLFGYIDWFQVSLPVIHQVLEANIINGFDQTARQCMHHALSKRNIVLTLPQDPYVVISPKKSFLAEKICTLSREFHGLSNEEMKEYFARAMLHRNMCS